MSALSGRAVESGFEQARKVADAVLYEGYVLYPYRASAAKNQIRWQFGVVAPRIHCEAEGGERWFVRTEVLVEGARPVVDLKLRFLRVQSRTIEDASGRPVPSLEVDGRLWTSWDEAVEEELDVEALGLGERVVSFDLPPTRTVEQLGADRLALAHGAGAPRDEVVRRSLAAVHTLLAVHHGRFVSLVDPPEFAAPAVSRCVNEGTWPVLVGEEGGQAVVLSSPITLYDYPQVAPESPGDMFDATEIDEILALRVLTLTDEEKREARGTDDRAAAIIDRVDAMPPELFDKLHGAVRYLRTVGGAREVGDPGARSQQAWVGGVGAPADSDGRGPQDPGARSQQAWWDPGQDASVDPFADTVWIGAHDVGRGARVRLRPTGRADAHDMFLVGRMATVEGVFLDVDGDTHVAVTLDDDPGADMARTHGRYLYFRPDELEPV